jgi:predicted acetyltransferase
MPEISIREVTGQEMLEVMFPLLIYAFVPSPPLPNKEEWLEKYVQPREGLTYVALFEDGTPVTGAGSKEMTQQVRGGLFGMSAIWGVASMPQARRKGYAKRVMGHLLAVLREAGQPLSTLYPFRESFYERLGYVTLPGPQAAKFSPLGLLPLMEKDLGGQVEITLIGEAYEDYQDYLHQVQNLTQGMAVPKASYRSRMERRPCWLAQAKVDGQLVGIMVYKLMGAQINQFCMQVTRFHYSTTQGKYLLLEWIARHADQATNVELWLSPDERPETWLPDLKVKTELLDEIPMGRVVDIAKIGGMQVGPGGFSAHFSDPLCPWNEGIWKIETVDGLLRISQAKEAECELKIQALSALVYGSKDPSEFVMHGWGNPSPQIQVSMRSMFPRLLPYLAEVF